MPPCRQAAADRIGGSRAEHGRSKWHANIGISVKEMSVKEACMSAIAACTLRGLGYANGNMLLLYIYMAKVLSCMHPN